MSPRRKNDEKRLCSFGTLTDVVAITRLSLETHDIDASGHFAAAQGIEMCAEPIADALQL